MAWTTAGCGCTTGGGDGGATVVGGGSATGGGDGATVKGEAEGALAVCGNDGLATVGVDDGPVAVGGCAGTEGTPGPGGTPRGDGGAANATIAESGADVARLDTATARLTMGARASTC